MGKKNYHVVPKGEKWAVKGEGAKKADSLHDTQKEASERSKELAKKHLGESVIHRPDGRIRDKDSYGPDPCPPVDKKH
jgi:hypothetical protein